MVSGGAIIYYHLADAGLLRMSALDEEISEIQERYGIIGRRAEIERALASLSAHKHLMIEGPVGVGKTVLALAVAKHLGAKVFRIDGDERYTEQKLAGWFDPPLVLQKGYVDEAFIPGPLTQAMRAGSVLFVNELNRMPEGVQNILLPAMDEGMIEVPKVGTVEASPGFVIIATQNPREFVATTALSEAISDRFELLLLDYQSAEEETEIASRRFPEAPRELVERAVWITRRTRTHPNIRRGASVRAALSISELAGRFSSDMIIGIRKAAHMAVPPRIEMREESKASVHEIIDEIVDECFSVEVDPGGRMPPSGERESPRRPGGDGNTRMRQADVADLLPMLRGSNGNWDADSDDIGWSIAKQYSQLRFALNDPALAELARRIAIRATIRRVLQLLGPVNLPSKLERCEFVPGMDHEIDVEATLDNLTGQRHIDLSDLVVESREPKKMAVALILDASLSMTGDKLAMATAAIAVLAYRLKTVDYLLITFNDRPKTVKKVDEKVNLDDLVADLLSSSATGYTNIEAALKRGSEELSRATASNKVGILITDGNFTVGDDPADAASAYRRLFVVMTESHDCRPFTCDTVARNGGGRMFPVSTFDEIPRVLYRVLRMVSHGAPG
jgi:MoxR-like ATPase/Mg-chelatase subunit ChlD